MSPRSIAFALNAKWLASFFDRGAGAVSPGAFRAGLDRGRFLENRRFRNGWLHGRRRHERRQIVRIERHVGAHEGRFAAEPLGNQRVGVRLVHQHEGAPEPFDVGALPRLARHEVLGDDARFRRRPGRDVGVGELRLRAVHRRFEPAVDADLDQPHQGRHVSRDARDELLQRRGGGRPVALRDGHVGRQFDSREPDLRRLLGQVPADERDLVASRGIVIEQAPSEGQAVRTFPDRS